MNRSGQAVVALALYYKICRRRSWSRTTSRPAAGTVKLKRAEAPPGITACGTSRHGCRRRTSGGCASASATATLALAQEVADFVLHPPSREHEAAIDESIGRALEVVRRSSTGSSSGR